MTNLKRFLLMRSLLKVKAPANKYRRDKTY